MAVIKRKKAGAVAEEVVQTETVEQPVETTEVEIQIEESAEVVEQPIEETPEATQQFVYLAKGEKFVIADTKRLEKAVYELLFDVVDEKLLIILNQLEWKFLERPEDSLKYLRTVLGQHCKNVKLLNVQSI